MYIYTVNQYNYDFVPIWHKNLGLSIRKHVRKTHWKTFLQKVSTEIKGLYWRPVPTFHFMRINTFLWIDQITTVTQIELTITLLYEQNPFETREYQLRDLIPRTCPNSNDSFFKSYFSARFCGAISLRITADGLVVLWWNLMCDVWWLMVCDLCCSL